MPLHRISIYRILYQHYLCLLGYIPEDAPESNINIAIGTPSPSECATIHRADYEINDIGSSYSDIV